MYVLILVKKIVWAGSVYLFLYIFNNYVFIRINKNIMPCIQRLRNKLKNSMFHLLNKNVSRYTFLK